MFTGIIESLGKIKKTSSRKGGLELEIDLTSAAKGIKAGDSVAVCGVCLTVESLKQRIAKFYLSSETLSKSWLGSLKPGNIVNLETAAKLGNPIGGHLVQGHVDGVGKVLCRKKDGEGESFSIEAPEELKPYLLLKGSIAVDGVSLTIASVKGREFSIALIPFTLEQTNLQFKKPGDLVNLEADLIGKWVRQLTRNS